MRKVLVVEDNPASVAVMKNILYNINKEIKVYAVDNVSSAYQCAMEQTIDLFIVDIILDNNVQGDVSGIIFADRLRNVKRYEFAPLIFITSLEDPKLHAYRKLHCYDYLEKPFDLDEAEHVIAKALEFPKVSEEREFIYFRKDGILYSRKLEDIIYIESMQRKVTIYSTNDELVIPYKTCKDMLRELDSELFLQCNRSTIVNQRYIEYVDGGNRLIQLRGISEKIELGVVMKKKFLKALEDEA